MASSRNVVFMWIPRVLTIMYALFLGAFAMDVFDEGPGFPEAVLAFLMHLAPVYVVLLILLFAWRWPLAGTAAYALAGTAYALTAQGRLDWILPISGPLFIVSALYLLDWIIRRRGAHPAGGAQSLQGGHRA